MNTVFIHLQVSFFKLFLKDALIGYIILGCLIFSSDFWRNHSDSIAATEIQFSLFNYLLLAIKCIGNLGEGYFCFEIFFSLLFRRLCS